MAEAYCGEGDTCLRLSNQSSLPADYYNQALTAYRQAVTLISTHPKYMVKIGNTHVAIGDVLSNPYQSKAYEQALDWYERAIQSSPNYASAYVGKGDVLHRLHRPEEALAAYEAALEHNQYQPQAYSGKGYLLLESNCPEAALAAFDHALSMENNNAYYHFGKGQALVLLERYQDALSAYDMARNCGLKSMNLLVQRATVLLELADAERTCFQQAEADHYYVEAFFTYTSLEQGWSEDDNICYSLGRIHFAWGDWNTALLYYQKAIDKAPYKADAYIGAGKTLIELGNSKDAFTYFDNALKLCHHPRDEASVLIAYGDAYTRIAEKFNISLTEYYDHQEIARGFYEKALSIHEHVMAFVGLGKTLTALHYHKEATGPLQRALELNPRLAECYFIEGECCYNLGWHLEAYDLYEKAIASGFDNAAIRNAQGDVLLEMKSYRGAIKAFDYVIDHVKEEIEHAYAGKGMALYALGMNREALQSFEEANRLDNALCLRQPYKRTLENISSSIDGLLFNNTQDASAYRDKGDVLLLLREQIGDVIDAYTMAIEYGDRSVDVYCRRGEAYFMQGEYRKALKDYKKALEIDPGDLQAKQGEKMVEGMKDMIVQKQETFIKRLAFWWKSR